MKTLTAVRVPAAIRSTSDVRLVTTGPDAVAHVWAKVVDDHGRLVPDAVVDLS